MKKEIKQLMRRALRKAKWIWRIADLLRDRLEFPDRSFGVFTDSEGNSHRLLQGLRDQIKPGWGRCLDRESEDNIPTDAECWKKALYGYERV